MVGSEIALVRNQKGDSTGWEGVKELQPEQTRKAGRYREAAYGDAQIAKHPFPPALVANYPLHTASKIKKKPHSLSKMGFRHEHPLAAAKKGM
jgi:hypothetical protein